MKKFSGLMIAAGLAVLIIMTAHPGTLAMIDVGLIGLLYVVRRRRQPDVAARIRKDLFEVESGTYMRSRGASLRARA